MTTRQAFQAHVGFEFGVKLLAGAVIVVQSDYFIRQQLVEAAPVGIDLILGEQQCLALFGMPFGNLKNDWVGQWIAVDVFTSLSDPYTFSRTDRLLFAGFFCQINPLLNRFSTQIPFDDKVDILSGIVRKVVLAVVS